MKWLLLSVAGRVDLGRRGGEILPLHVAPDSWDMHEKHAGGAKHIAGGARSSHAASARGPGHLARAHPPPQHDDITAAPAGH